jgi:hypothetical protein
MTMESFERVGEWWLPENPNRKASGILKFEPITGGTLQLIGALVDIQDGDQPSHPPVILGKCLGGKVTLLNNSETRSQLTLEGIGISIFQTGLICDGIHLQNKNDLEFVSLSIHYSYLNQWIGVSSFNINHFYETGELNINCKNSVEVCKISLNENIQLSIDVLSYSKENWVKDVHIDQIAYVTIKFSDKHPLNEIEKIMRNFQNFLSFAIQHPIHPLNVNGLMIGDRFDCHDGTYKQGHVYVKLYRPYLDNLKNTQSDLFPRESVLFTSDIIFGFNQISNKFEFLIKNWFEKAKWLENVYDLYFATVYSNLYLQNVFLLLIQALEVYHRKNPHFEQYEISEDKHFEKISSILEKVPIEYKDWLEAKLKYSNEKRLATRLEAVFNYLSDVLLELSNIKSGFTLLSTKKYQNSLVRKITNNRNYLTHYDQSLKSQAANESELYRITEKLKIIICLCLMKELGFDKEEITHFLSNGNVGLLMEWALNESVPLIVDN